MSTPLLAHVGPQTIVIVLLVGILLFGNKLPEMGRVLARTIWEFRKTMSGIEDEVTASVRHAPDPGAQLKLPQRVTASEPSAAERNGLAPEAPGA
jgi:sec-independent protein translocase protein TatA